MNDKGYSIEEIYSQAMTAYQAGDYAESERQLRHILEHQPDHDGILATLGGVLLAAGQLERGIEALEKALAINPDNPEALLNAGIAYQHTGQVERALSMMERANELSPQRTDMQFNLANTLIQLNRVAEGQKLLEEINARDSGFLPACHALGAVYQYTQQTAAAIRLYERALQVVPGDLQSLISLANLLADTGQTERAEQAYQQATTKHPDYFLPHAAIGKFYLDIGQQVAGEQALQRAYALHPEDLNVNILLGNVNRDLGRKEAAEQYYRHALEIHPGDPGATANLRRILSSEIPYWHFEMLADTERNDAYQRAIEKVVNPTTKVLDIGTGSGLLAMMCARAGAQWVTACEMHERLAATARDIVALNGYEDRIAVYHKKSSLLQLGAELPAKVDLIVSEILDVGGLGEGVLPSIRQAWQNYAHPQTRLIPSGMELHAQLIEIPGRSRVAPVREVAGFDLSPFEQYRIPNEYLKVILRAEKHRKLSPVQSIMNVDFYNLPPAYADDQPLVTTLEFPITSDGELQAVIFWFDLQLDDEIMVSSRPDGALEHWGQALFCFPAPRAVKAGEIMRIKMLQSDMLIKFELAE